MSFILHVYGVRYNFCIPRCNNQNGIHIALWSVHSVNEFIGPNLLRFPTILVRYPILIPILPNHKKKILPYCNDITCIFFHRQSNGASLWEWLHFLKTYIHVCAYRHESMFPESVAVCISAHCILHSYFPYHVPFSKVQCHGHVTIAKLQDLVCTALQRQRPCISFVAL